MRVATGILALAVIGCGAPPPPVDRMADIKPDGMPTYEAFVSSARFPYEVAAARRQQIQDGLSKAQTCITKHDVEGLLGRPDYSRPMCPKDPRQKCTGTEWTYFLKTRDANSAGIDSSITVFFSTSDRARWFATENALSMREVGGPDEKCT